MTKYATKYSVRSSSQNSPLRRGQAIIEMALIAPVLLMLLMLIVQYSIIMNAAVSLTNLSREGARFAATQPATDAAIRTRMQNVCPPTIKWSDISGTGGVIITPAQGSAGRTNRGTLIKVEIDYNMQNKLFLPSTFFGIPLFAQIYKAQTTMMVEG